MLVLCLPRTPCRAKRQYTLHIGRFVRRCNIITPSLLFMQAVKTHKAVAVLSWVTGVATKTIPPHRRWYSKRKSQKWTLVCVFFLHKVSSFQTGVYLSFCTGILFLKGGKIWLDIRAFHPAVAVVASYKYQEMHDRPKCHKYGGVCQRMWCQIKRPAYWCIGYKQLCSSISMWVRIMSLAVPGIRWPLLLFVCLPFCFTQTKSTIWRINAF